MKIAPFPENEAARFAALKNYQVLDTEAEQDFDDLTVLASQICGTPIALVSELDGQRQWFKSKFGIHEKRLEISRFAHIRFWATKQ